MNFDTKIKISLYEEMEKKVSTLEKENKILFKSIFQVKSSYSSENEIDDDTERVHNNCFNSNKDNHNTPKDDDINTFTSSSSICTYFSSSPTDSVSGKDFMGKNLLDLRKNSNTCIHLSVGNETLLSETTSMMNKNIVMQYSMSISQLNAILMNTLKVSKYESCKHVCLNV